MPYRQLPRFDGTGAFVATRAITLLGKQLQEGDLIPSGLPAMRIRQLYDRRMVMLATHEQAPTPKGAAKKG